MPLFSWLVSSAATASRSPEEGKKNNIFHVNESLDFGRIADKVESLQQELALARELCERANLRFDKYRAEIDMLKAQVAKQQAKISALHNGLAAEKARSASLQAKFHGSQTEVNKLRLLASQSQAKAKMETAALDSITQHARCLEQQYAETQFDLEYLKCVTNAERLLERPAWPDSNVLLPPQPFVVVLVDGDAYRVSFMLPKSFYATNPIPISGLQTSFQIAVGEELLQLTATTSNLVL